MKPKKPNKPAVLAVPNMRQRISQAKLTTAQWNAFTTAVKALKAQTVHPNYDDFVMAHIMDRHQMQAHERYTFLPWHRVNYFRVGAAILPPPLPPGVKRRKEPLQPVDDSSFAADVRI